MDVVSQDNNTIDLYCSINGGAWTPIAENEGNDGVYEWTTSGLFNSNDVKVKIEATDATGNTGSDTSADAFIIDSQSPVVTLITPNGGEILQGGVSLLLPGNQPQTTSLWQRLPSACPTALMESIGNSLRKANETTDSLIGMFLYSTMETCSFRFRRLTGQATWVQTFLTISLKLIVLNPNRLCSPRWTLQPERMC